VHAPIVEPSARSGDDLATGRPRLTVIDTGPALSDHTAGELLMALLARLVEGRDVRHPAHVASALVAALRCLPLEAG